MAEVSLYWQKIESLPDSVRALGSSVDPAQPNVSGLTQRELTFLVRFKVSRKWGETIEASHEWATLAKL